jgi:hypothetical protein
MQVYNAYHGIDLTAFEHSSAGLATAELDLVAIMTSFKGVIGYELLQSDHPDNGMSGYGMFMTASDEAFQTNQSENVVVENSPATDSGTSGTDGGATGG